MGRHSERALDGDREFDAKGSNRCQGLGIGVLFDLRDVTQRTQLEATVAEAELGLATRGVAAATRNAAAAEITLRKAYCWATAVVPFFVADGERPTH